MSCCERPQKNGRTDLHERLTHGHWNPQLGLGVCPTEDP